MSYEDNWDEVEIEELEDVMEQLELEMEVLERQIARLPPLIQDLIEEEDRAPVPIWGGYIDQRLICSSS